MSIGNIPSPFFWRGTEDTGEGSNLLLDPARVRIGVTASVASGPMLKGVDVTAAPFDSDIIGFVNYSNRIGSSDTDLGVVYSLDGLLRLNNEGSATAALTATSDGFTGSGYGNHTQAHSFYSPEELGATVVSYTGNGSTRTLAHGLGATPDFVMIFRANSNSTFCSINDLQVGLGSNHIDFFHGSDGVGTGLGFDSQAADDTNLYLGAGANANGIEFRAVCFFNNDKFQCGSYTGNGTNQDITTGFRPGFIAIASDTLPSGHCHLDVWDDARFSREGSAPVLGAITPLATGFNVDETTNGGVNDDTIVHYWFAIVTQEAEAA